MATKVVAKSGKNLEIINRKKAALMFFPEIYFIITHSFFFVESLFNILSFAVYVNMEILIQFQHAFVCCIGFLYRSRGNIKLLAKRRLVIGFKLLAIIIEQRRCLRIAQYFLFKLFRFKGVSLLKVVH